MNSFDYLIVCAHPDDAFLGMGGTIRKLTQEKKRVLIVCATNGENGDVNHGEIRKKELACSCNMLGCEFLMLQLKDGELDYHLYELYLSIADLFIQNNPQYVFTHHSMDSHSDHLAVYTAVHRATEKLWHTHKQETRLKALVSFLPIRLSIDNIPGLLVNRWVTIDTSKRELLLPHQSQMPYLEINIEKHMALNRYLGVLTGAEMAEGFWLEGPNVSKMLDF